MKKRIKSDDKKYIWHPFTKLSNDYDPLVISSAKDDKLVDIDGKEYFDLISSWWVNIHGHGKKEIIKALISSYKNLNMFYLLILPISQQLI